MGKEVCIHANRGIYQQRRYSERLAESFKRHGYSPRIVGPEGEADIHVVLGPHFAKDRWLGHPRTILLDRCYYRGDPDHVSLGWMRPDGGRWFHRGQGRSPPELPPERAGNRTLFLADYQGIIEPADTIRYHPAQKAPDRPLEDDLRDHDVAIGYNTTTLVAAALSGLRVICKGAQNIMAETDWLQLLPYADWGYHELDDAIEHLLCHSPS